MSFFHKSDDWFVGGALSDGSESENEFDDIQLSEVAVVHDEINTKTGPVLYSEELEKNEETEIVDSVSSNLEPVSRRTSLMSTTGTAQSRRTSLQSRASLSENSIGIDLGHGLESTENMQEPPIKSPPPTAVNEHHSLCDHTGCGFTLELLSSFQFCVKHLQEALGADRSTIFYIDHEKSEMYSISSLDFKQFRMPTWKGIAGDVATRGQVVNIPDVYKDPRFNPEYDKKSGYKTNHLLCFPILDHRKQVLAVIQLINKLTGPCFSEDDMLITESFSDSIAPAFSWYVSYQQYMVKLLKNLETGGFVYENVTCQNVERNVTDVCTIHIKAALAGLCDVCIIYFKDHGHYTGRYDIEGQGTIRVTSQGNKGFIEQSLDIIDKKKKKEEKLSSIEYVRFDQAHKLPSFDLGFVKDLNRPQTVLCIPIFITKAEKDDMCPSCFVQCIKFGTDAPHIAKEKEQVENLFHTEFSKSGQVSNASLTVKVLASYVMWKHYKVKLIKGVSLISAVTESVTVLEAEAKWERDQQHRSDLQSHKEKEKFITIKTDDPVSDKGVSFSSQGSMSGSGSFLRRGSDSQEAVLPDWFKDELSLKSRRNGGSLTSFSPKRQSKVHTLANAAKHVVSNSMNHGKGRTESLDYDFVETGQLIENGQSGETKVYVDIGVLLNSLLLTATGVLTATVYYCLAFLFATPLKKVIFPWESKDDSVMVSLQLIGIGVGLLSVTVILVITMAPRSAGSGVPLVSAFLNGNHIPGVFSFSTLVAKLLGLMSVLASTLPFGTQGPMFHVGSLLGAATYDFVTMYIPWTKRFINRKDKRILISAGAAAGVGSSFNAPIAGVLMAQHEGSSFWSSAITMKVFYTAMFSVIVLATYTNGPLGGIYTQSGIQYGAISYTMKFSDVPIVFLVAICGGLLSGVISRLCEWNIYLFALKPIKTSLKLRFLLSMLLLIAVTAITVLVPQSSRNSCTPFNADILADYAFDFATFQPMNRTLVAQFYKERFGSDIPFYHPVDNVVIMQYGCQDDEYNVLMTYMLGCGTPEKLSALYASVERVTILQPFLWHIIGIHAAVMCLIYAGPFPMGITTPLMVIGACFGHIFAEAVEGVFDMNYANLALVGSAALAAGVSRQTLSLVVMFVEMTSTTNHIVTIMITVLVSKQVSEKLAPPLYNVVLRLDSVPMVNEAVPGGSKYKSARDVMVKNVKTIPSICTVKAVVEILSESKHNGFPVIRTQLGSQGLFEGIVQRDTLVKILRMKLFHVSPEQAIRARKHMGHVNLEGQQKGGLEEDVYPTKGDLRKFVDVQAHADAGVYVMREDAPVERIYRLFRHVGLRHLTIVDEHNRVQGIVTRKDLVNFGR